MKICVTGGAGFIGSHTVDKYLELGHEVVIIDNLSTGLKENINKNAKFYNVDSNDPRLASIFNAEKFDLVCHEAAQMNVRHSVDDARHDAHNNIIGSLSVFEAAKNSGVKKIIFASSGGTVYGDQFTHPAPESHELNPCSPYGIAKLAIEKYLLYYSSNFDIKHTILRYGNVYGPRQNPKGEAGVVSIFIDNMKNGKQSTINGDGSITRDYIFIDDVVSANVLALSADIEGIFNVGTGIEITVQYIYDEIKRIMNSNLEPLFGTQKIGEQMRSSLSSELLSKRFGWLPAMPFPEGLKLTIDSIISQD